MSAARLRIGVVGTGALGRHHVRLLSELPEVELVAVFDADSDRGAAIAREYDAPLVGRLEELADRAEAAVVAVPTVSHADVGCALLERGLNVLVEKPIAPSLAEADRLIEAATAGGRVLAAGHVEFFNPAVQALLGFGSRPRYVVVERLGVFSPRSLDVDVILDLMIHDLQILQALDGSAVAEIRAVGVDVLSPRVDIANVRLAFESGCVANLTASRVSAERVRTLRAFLETAYVSLDYQKQEIKGGRLSARDDGGKDIAMFDLAVERAEPLRRELEAFVAACRGESVRLVDGTAARRALETALAATAAVVRGSR